MNSEFEPLSEEELKKSALPMNRWECTSCGTRHLKFGLTPPEDCHNCSGTSFKRIINVHSVPATTGFETELKYDNLDSIDQAVEEGVERETQDKDLEKLEKARR